jgi:hypothetical protein
MAKIDPQDQRISAILGGKVPDVTEDSLAAYLAYLKAHLTWPCQLTGVEDFDWEEYYVLGPGDEGEYEHLKKTRPSYRDRFNLISLEDELDEGAGILAKVQRVSDKKRFTIPLAELKATERKSPNYRLLDDYSVWFVNYR